MLEYMTNRGWAVSIGIRNTYIWKKVNGRITEETRFNSLREAHDFVVRQEAKKLLKKLEAAP